MAVASSNVNAKDQMFIVGITFDEIFFDTIEVEPVSLPYATSCHVAIEYSLVFWVVGQPCEFFKTKGVLERFLGAVVGVSESTYFEKIMKLRHRGNFCIESDLY